MEFEDKEEAIQALILETFDHCRVGELVPFPEGGTITLYFEDTRDNDMVAFSDLLNQLNYKFSILTINTIPPSEKNRLGVTLIFDLKNIDEEDFW